MENKVVIQYNNVANPFLLVKLFDGEKVTNSGLITFNKNELEDNLPVSDALINEIDRFLSSKEINRTSIYFVLNCFETTKITTIIPNVNERKIRKIYDVDLANKISSLDKYDRTTTTNDVGENKVFYEFMVEKRFREYFENVGNKLGYENVSVEHYYSYLFKDISELVKAKTYVYFYEEKGITSMLLVIDDVLTAYSSFESTINNYRLNIASIIENHSKSLEKVDISMVYANRNIECLKEIDPIVLGYVIGK